jgi:choline dehydrogenase-like flavoprotein
LKFANSTQKGKAVPIIDANALAEAYDVCVVGGGPAGISCALRGYNLGLKVLLVEAGGFSPTPGYPEVNAVTISDSEFHDPAELTGASALGGSSHWWGGRCVPLDACDLVLWPVPASELEEYWNEAADFLGGRAISESPQPADFELLRSFDVLRDETWGPELNMARRWRRQLHSRAGPDVLLHSRVMALAVDGSAVAGVTMATERGTVLVKADHTVLACGGLASVRMLLATGLQHPHLFGGKNSQLGAGYMGHLTGSVANLCLEKPEHAQAFFFRQLEHGATARRRFRPTADAVQKQGLVNVAFWLENGSAASAEHGSSVSSAKFVAASLVAALKRRGSGFTLDRLRPHLRNVAREPWAAFCGLVQIAMLLASSRLTGRHPRPKELTPVRPGVWQLCYHGEQVRHATNRLSLATENDAAGMPKLSVDFRFEEADVEAVLRVHEQLDADLRQAGIGHLEFVGDRGRCLDTIRLRARDGYHQMGGACMHSDAACGVVDTDCHVHGMSGLWVAAGCVFPSGSQANPTLTIVALALRVADAIARRARSGASEVSKTSARSVSHRADEIGNI